MELFVNVFGLNWIVSQKIPTWVEMESMSEAKSKIGHAVMMILQVGVLEKFKNIPLSSAVDLACFAAAVIISSASIFFLSKLNMGGGGSGGFKWTTPHGGAWHPQIYVIFLED